MKRIFQWVALTMVAALLAACGGVQPMSAPDPKPEAAPAATEAAQATQAAPAEVEAGPVSITGQVTYTNPFFTEGVAQPIIVLEDQGGFVTRDRKFVIPPASQVLGEITSDFYVSPFTYSLALPAQPNGTLHDVDHDSQTETGVMIFAVAYWTNTWGDPYLEKRDQGGGGWSGAYASTKVSDDRDAYMEVYGGKYLVYAPDDQQSFPADFGADKKLFTDDDAVMDLPAGWSVIDLDQTPFGIDRSATPTIDLLEPESAALVNFSDLSYTAAFDKMVEKFKKEYAFTEFKQIDWDAKAAEFRPAFEAAEKAKDPHAYSLALRDFIWSIPDSHVAFDTSLVADDFAADTAGGIGIAIRETDDGKVIANFILDGSPAAAAGMKWGAEIIAFDGKAIAQVVDEAKPWSLPFSNPEIERLQKLRYATRFRMEKGTIKVAFKNPGETEQTATLNVVPERDSFSFSSFRAGEDSVALPVEFDMLPSGYGYLKISSFLDNDVLSIQVLERAIKYFNDNQVPGVVIDMRNNGGGSGWLADQMAAYFFSEEIVVGNTARYNKGSGEFYMDPGDEQVMLPPRAELQYTGPVAVLVGPNCVSACEFFSYNMTINDRATIVGQYSSNGAGGSVEQFKMPEDLIVQITIGRSVDADGNIHLEGRGVAPDVRVPVTAETLKRIADGEDVILETAEKVLSAPPGAGVTPAAPPQIASPAESESAFTSGAKFLEDFAREQPDAAAFAQPGTVSYVVVLTGKQTALWAYAWCAADEATMKANFANIELKFEMNGAEIPADSFAVFETENNGNYCRLVYAALSSWSGGEHHLTTTATFTSKINDGMGDYEPGDYVLDYAVYVKP